MTNDIFPDSADPVSAGGARLLPPGSGRLAVPGSKVVPVHSARILVLGIGNEIMSDDGVGPALVKRLMSADDPDVVFVDGGTCGLALLPFIEDADTLIVVDAARFGHAPGTVSIVEGEALDKAIRGVKSTAHEVALADLLDAAVTTGGQPERRALIAIEPDYIRVGVTLSSVVHEALPEAEAAIKMLIKRWSR